MKITYIERNGRKYAYTATSVRVPGKEHPVTKSTYLGVVDPMTGEIVRKGERTVPDEPRISDGKFRIRNLGDALIAYRSALQIGIPNDLQRVFGDQGSVVLALAIAQTTHPSSIDESVLTIENSCIPEIVGMDRQRLRARVSETLKSIDMKHITMFFKMRMHGSNDEVMICGRTVNIFGRSLNSDMNVRYGGEWRHGDTNLQMHIGVDGRPLSFDYHTGSTIGMNLIGYSNTNNPRCIVVADSYLGHPLAIVDMVLKHVRFAVLADVDSDTIYRMLDKLTKSNDVRFNEISLRNHVFHSFQVRLGLSLSGEQWSFMTEHDEGYDECAYHLNAMVCRDPVAAKFESRCIKEILSWSRSAASESKADEIGMIVSRLGPLKDAVDIVHEGDSYALHVRRDDINRIKSRAGISVILTSEDDIGYVLELFRSRKNAFSDMKYALDGISGHWGTEDDPARLHSELFVRFLASMIRAAIRSTLGEGSKYSVDGVLNIASSYSMAVIGDAEFRSSMGLKVSSVLEMFGIDASDPFNKRCLDPYGRTTPGT